jgi:hypothetical protein
MMSAFKFDFAFFINQKSQRDTIGISILPVSQQKKNG